MLWPIDDAATPWHRGSRESPALTMTFQFATGQNADFWVNYEGWQAFSGAQKAAVVSVLREFSEVINVSFKSTAEADPDLNFGRVDLGYGGEGRFQYSCWVDGEGNVTDHTWDGFAVFNYERSLLTAADRNLLLHEIGHTLGLKHPGNYDVGGTPPPPPYLSAAEDTNQYTVMSYNAHATTGEVAAHLMLYDIVALQAMWGANYSTRAGNTVYFGPASAAGFALDDGESEAVCIWDGGGRDTFSAQNQTSRVTIDLRQGAFSSIGPQRETISIAYGAVIENATGGSAGDRLTGNDGANVLYGLGGGDRLEGLAGRDVLGGGNGNDTVSGGAGNDVLAGGIGADRQTGGAGADRFDFNAARESAVAAFGRDVILAFGAGDRIDLGGIDAVAGGGDNDFDFIGARAFFGLGQVRAYVRDGNTFIDVNCASTLAADMRIQIAGAAVLDATDFVL